MEIIARREKTGASVEEVGVPSFVGVRSCLLNIFSFFNKNILNNKKKIIKIILKKQKKITKHKKIEKK